MLTKIYIALWAIIVTSAVVMFLIGGLSELMIVAYGFICFGMVFMGMISVLPTAVHDSLIKH
ncbi:MAG: hypothetical protein JNK51_02420 [Blastocatellia bacterium]|nr:hypothetical protein [Chloracidobacterium sp.]MBL8183754.1 hypothetical protein [Blastocatellia bacterium]HBE83720.1 hypothetical protein [Blastocatellia bacterium]HRJ87855.1 hypothetical protein [Pyrinomonadaceae bacterium]HRK49998.1 hypothetical protein [Pyrinomonadaceae bacterium]